jgi:hypothetical protein
MFRVVAQRHDPDGIHRAHLHGRGAVTPRSPAEPATDVPVSFGLLVMDPRPTASGG